MNDRDTDDEWVARFAGSRMSGAALRWLVHLPDDDRNSWDRLQQALITQFPTSPIVNVEAASTAADVQMASQLSQETAVASTPATSKAASRAPSVASRYVARLSLPFVTNYTLLLC